MPRLFTVVAKPLTSAESALLLTLLVKASTELDKLPILSLSESIALDSLTSSLDRLDIAVALADIFLALAAISLAF